MTQWEVNTWNAAIDAALLAMKGGRGAIAALRVRHVVVVEHVGRSTRQDVVEVWDVKDAS